MSRSQAPVRSACSRPFTPHTAKARATCSCSATPLQPNDDFPPSLKAAVEMESIKKHFRPAMSRSFRAIRRIPPTLPASQNASFLYSLCCSRNGQPTQSAGFRALSYRRQIRKMIRPSSTPATSFIIHCMPSWSLFHLPQRRRACVFGRRIGRPIVGLRPRRSAQRDRALVG